MPVFPEARLLPAPSRADRDIPNASKGHCTGFTLLGGEQGFVVQAESHTELCLMTQAAMRPEVVDLREQVCFLYGRNREFKHYFDFVTILNDGRQLAYTVKPEARLTSGRFLDHMQTVSWWVRRYDFADAVKLLTEGDIDPVSLHNAKIFNALRDPDPAADAAARSVASETRGGVSLHDLSRLIGLEERGYRALLRLLRAGEITLVRHSRISPSTLVQWKGLKQ